MRHRSSRPAIRERNLIWSRTIKNWMANSRRLRVDNYPHHWRVSLVYWISYIAPFWFELNSAGLLGPEWWRNGRNLRSMFAIFTNTFENHRKTIGIQTLNKNENGEKKHTKTYKMYTHHTVEVALIVFFVFFFISCCHPTNTRIPVLYNNVSVWLVFIFIF